MKNFHITYADGTFLTDDAILYDCAALRRWYGDLIPLWKDEGLCCSFDTLVDYEEYCPSVADAYHERLDFVRLKKALVHAENTLLAGMVQQVTLVPSVRFPNPEECPWLYRVLIPNDPEGNLSIIIFYGLSSERRKIPEVNVYFLIEWLRIVIQMIEGEVER